MDTVSTIDAFRYPEHEADPNVTTDIDWSRTGFESLCKPGKASEDDRVTAFTFLWGFCEETDRLIRGLYGMAPTYELTATAHRSDFAAHTAQLSELRSELDEVKTRLNALTCR